MKKTKLLLGVAVMLFALAAWAQSDDQQNNSSASHPITVRGCITGSQGVYVLMGQSKGEPYNLQGNNAELAKVIQHQVEVSGRIVNETGNNQANNPATSGATAPPGATLQVQSIREISDKCFPVPSR